MPKIGNNDSGGVIDPDRFESPESPCKRRKKKPTKVRHKKRKKQVP